MKQVIQEFLDGKQVAIAGASSKDTNFGKSLMQEFVKLGYTVYPINPRCTEIDGIPCLASVKELPAGVENLILVVPHSVTDEIFSQCVGTPFAGSGCTGAWAGVPCQKMPSGSAKSTGSMWFTVSAP